MIMKPRTLILSPSYLAFVQGVRELHRLAVAGQHESPEADAVRDATDLPWEGLTEAERKRASGLSEDLYSISEPSPSDQKEMNPQAQSKLNDFYETRQRGEWDKALEILRRWGTHLSPSLISYLRGTVWAAAGDHASASLFFEHALQLESSNGAYLAAYALSLNMVTPEEARRFAENILRSSDTYPPEVVVRAVGIAMGPTQAGTEFENPQRFHRFIPILQETLARIEQGDDHEAVREICALALAFLGLCHEWLGENQAALDSYTKGLDIDPLNESLLMARGMLYYGVSPRAITDLESAIKNGSQLIWPYFFLAHHEFASGRFDHCRLHCEQALKLEGTSEVKSELTEWLAIAQAQLGFPVELVRAAFEEAIRLDPSNERARRNLAIFEDATRPVAADPFEMRSASAVRASALTERRYGSAA